MQPEIDLFGLPVKTFGLCFGLAFVVSGAIVARRLKELGKPVDWAYEIVFAALIGGLVGARLYWVLGNLDEVRDDVIANVFGGSGLVWFGGALGGAAGVLLWAHRKGMFNLTLLDICSPALALGYAVGRVGCQVSGDGDYGTATDLPWGMAFPDGVVPTNDVVHPAPIYETLTMCLVGWWLWRMRETFRPGVLFGLYLVLAGAERLLVEFVRRNEPVLAGLTEAQLLSIVMMIAGLAWLWIRARPDGLRRENGDAHAGAAAAAT
ncbi:MAG: Prolipoprotein diacylglyceryl transferase [uncultured Solirubrobacteraceae bacterium]|uniref:Phosphatidylglycerol--prolipoprotein diacylglyceryl transferase n=1 Tax=uncultured Solirubrobacteraceae bacterium TaxID=1162706 RepID=A0A6J4T6N0_9ACTN|nr:MAG: Prolipoprotein diacylglyceryl transferase [uncultured Solirubrobacteraceae bacterium]